MTDDAQMFTVEERDHCRARLLALAQADIAICGAAITGSHATGGGDEWSDIDLAVAVRCSVDEALERCTDWLYREVDAVHHWDLPSGATVYRVFLLPGWLEVDIAFAPEAEFGPFGPNWRTVFGETVRRDPPRPADARTLAGRAWHHLIHARASIARGRGWHSEYWISAARDLVLALASLRLGHPANYVKGAHLLPPELTGQLEAALVASLEPAELTRAMFAAAAGLARELERTDAGLAARLNPMLAELAASAPADRSASANPGAHGAHYQT